VLLVSAAYANQFGEIKVVEMTGAKALIQALEKEGVDIVFGLPGGANLPIYDALVDANFRHIL